MSEVENVEIKVAWPHNWEGESLNENTLATERLPYLMNAVKGRTERYVDLGTGASGSVRIYSLEGKSYIVKEVSVGVSDERANCRVYNEIQLLSKIKTICENQFSCLLGWGKFTQLLSKRYTVPGRELNQNVYLLFFPPNVDYYSLCTDMQESSFFKNNGYLKGLKVCLNLAAALNNLHQRKVAHRDIKPDNLLVNPKTLQIKYIDFGGSCQEIGYGPSCTIACAGVSKLFLGTPGYYSPEQGWAWEPTAPFKSDIWSLGVVFYKLLEGKLPWGNNLNMDEFLNAFQTLSFFGPTEPNYYCIPDGALQSPTNEEFFKIIQDMTRLDPRNRPSMEKVLKRLENLENLERGRKKRFYATDN